MSDAGAHPADPRRRTLSARRYFSWVALLTLASVAAFAWLRPSFAHEIRATLGLEHPPPQSPQSFYAVRVAPILEQHCRSCHGPGRQKAKLRLDSLGAALRGGKHGAVIAPGSVANSALVQRISLPVGNDRLMPPGSQSPLAPDDVTVIKLWIAAGASGLQPVSAFSTAPKPVAQVVIPAVDPRVVATERMPVDGPLRDLQQRFPYVIDYESRSSARLELDATRLGRGFGDRELAAFAPVGASIVRADLSGTAVGEASAQVLLSMKNLRTLRLVGVHAGPALAATLASMRERGVRVYADTP
jgi:hypothetical protein